MKAEGSAFDDELFTALCSGVQAFTSIPRFLLLRHHLHLPIHPAPLTTSLSLSLSLFLFLHAIAYRANSLFRSRIPPPPLSSNNTSRVSDDLIPFMR